MFNAALPHFFALHVIRVCLSPIGPLAAALVR